jgi:hypothetical protein
MIRPLIFLILFFCTCTASAGNYFVEFSASKSVSAMSVEFGETRLGPISVTKHGKASFGPITSQLPDYAIARWETEKGESRDQKIVFGVKAPFTFNALKFSIGDDDRLTVSFVVRIGGWRNLDIPFDESTEAAKLRELNESLYIAAGKGQLAAVQAAVEAGADINYLAGTIYPSPVRYAANGQHREVVKYLLSKGAQVKKRDLVARMLSELLNEIGREAE